MTVWMYYETDGDSGYYSIQLFSTEAKAEAYRKRKQSAYGGVEQIVVQ